jgi:hypothetical protein
MLERFNRWNKQRKNKEHRSGLEDKVEDALREQGFFPEYEKESFPYILHRKYKPDFKVGDVHVEVKGWWQSSDRQKFLSVVINNPDLKIFVALQRPHQTLSKKSKTTYAQWATKNGIAWCPIPIPKEFMDQWLKGERPTYHAPVKSVKARTGQRNTKTAPSSASSAKKDQMQMEIPGSQ